MDTLRGTFDSDEPADAKAFGDDALDDSNEDTPEPPAEDIRPPSIGTDERRMQVRAYNHWASLLEDRNFPAVQELDPEDLPEFGPYAVVLDFSQGAEDPIVRFLGEELGAECGAHGVIERLSDVPPRSLLSRITDHYMQILANQAPIGFEAEFVNLRGVSILYRGILLPFSSDDETIDFICGVINWKEMADAQMADELLLEIDQAIDGGDLSDRELEPGRHHADAMTDWADSPAYEAFEDDAAREAAEAAGDGEETAEDAAPEVDHQAEPDEADQSGFSGARTALNGASGPAAAPAPDFNQYGLDDYDEDEEYDEEVGEGASYGFASLSDYIEAPAKRAIDLDAEGLDPDDYRVEGDDTDEDSAVISRFGREAIQPDYRAEADDVQDVEAATAPEADLSHRETQAAADPEAIAQPASLADAPDLTALPEPGGEADLADWLASARELAQSATASEDRSRQTLYAAVSRAYDFSLAAKQAPDEYAALIEESGLAVQERAPMTPIVKLVFGSDYDKTRLTEYAAVLHHAHRIELERGTLARYLGEAEGGLKGVVKAERRLRREESGKAPRPERQMRAALAKQLRALEALTFDAITAEGPEFALVMVRRDGHGEPAVLGEIDEDIALVERAAKRLLG